MLSKSLVSLISNHSLISTGLRQALDVSSIFNHCNPSYRVQLNILLLINYWVIKIKTGADRVEDNFYFQCRIARLIMVFFMVTDCF